MADLDLRPRLVIRVAVTGHRLNRLAAGVTSDARFGALFQAIGVEVARLKDTLTYTDGKAPRSIFNGQTPLVRLITGMADGADSFAVQALADLASRGALKAHWVTDAILPDEPKPFADAMAGLETTETVAPAPPDAAREALAATLLAQITAAETRTILPAPLGARDYGEQAELILNQTDLVIALWDGKPGRGRGGTAHVVQQALDYDMPVIWLSSVDPAAPPRLLDSQALDRTGAVIPCAQGAVLDIPAVLRALVDLPRPSPRADGSTKDAHHADHDHHGKEPAPELAYAAFLNEPKRRRGSWLPRAYDGLVKLVLTASRHHSPPKPKAAAASVGDWRDAEWSGFVAVCGCPAPALGQLNEVIKPRFKAADDASVAYARRYRSAFVLAFLLSAIAVVLAVLSVAFKDAFAGFGLDEKAGKAVFVAVELIILSLIAVIVWRGHNERWHERWLDYRALAEALRQLRGRSLLGDDGGIDVHGRGRRAWWLWYLRASVREIGPPGTRLDAPFQRGVLAATRDHELSGQIKYHATNAHRMLHVHHGLHTAGTWGYGMAIAMLAVFLLMFGLYQFGHWPSAKAIVEGMKPWLGPLGVLLPTAGAALAAINNQADFLASGETSTEVERALIELAKLYDKEINPETSDPIYARTKALITQAAELMAADLLAFRAIYGRKPLVLPA
jgi:hypothetical protein